MQRSPERDASISRKLHDLLNAQIPTSDGDELADHDFDTVSHNGCDYEDNGKGLQLDVEKIIGASEQENASPSDYGDWYGYGNGGNVGNVEYELVELI